MPLHVLHLPIPIEDDLLALLQLELELVLYRLELRLLPKDQFPLLDLDQVELVLVLDLFLQLLDLLLGLSPVLLLDV